MNHRHLLPNEIDLLLDGDVGFGVAPLRTHVASCDLCAAELEEARAVVEALDHLPHFSPSPLFADRVMARTQVFQPWHVAALDTARKAVPRSAPARVLVGIAASTTALILTTLTVFFVTRLEALLFIGQLAVQRSRDAVLAALDGLAGSVLGDAAVSALQSSGGAGIAVAILAVVVSGALAAGGLRAAVSASRRNRSGAARASGCRGARVAPGRARGTARAGASERPDHPGDTA